MTSRRAIKAIIRKIEKERPHLVRPGEEFYHVSREDGEWLAVLLGLLSAERMGGWLYVNSLAIMNIQENPIYSHQWLKTATLNHCSKP